MKVQRILSLLLALPRLEQVAEQAHKAVRRRDEATVSALKAEIDELIVTLIPPLRS